MLADLEEQAAFPGVAQKYAKDMLRQLIHRRPDLIELKKQWLSFNRAIAAVKLRWSQLSEQDLRFDRWRICRG